MRPYQILHQSGELKQRVQLMNEKLKSCTVCPRHCLSNRWSEEEGFCLSGRHPIVSSVVAHFGEEPVLVGTNGAGNIFFGSCNLRCVYCQNWQISHPKNDSVQTRLQQPRKDEMTVDDLASKMIELQNKGCHNINFVSPSHFVPQLLEAIALACDKGLDLPLVYNTNAYDDLHTLQLLDGVIDIYLPDLKYANDLDAVRYSQARDYVAISQAAVKEMYRQVGNLQLDKNGLASKGIIVRHLVLPNDLAGTEETFEFLSKEISPEVTISLMAQYYPTNKAERIPLLSRQIRPSEYARAIDLLEKYGLVNGWLQELEAPEVYRPDFTREKPFDESSLQRQ